MYMHLANVVKKNIYYIVTKTYLSLNIALLFSLRFFNNTRDPNICVST